MVKDVSDRIDFLIKHINLVENDLEGKSAEELSESQLLARAVSFSIMQIGEQMIKLQDVLQEKYPDVPWSNARSMRNVIAHMYHIIDTDQVYDVAINELPKIKKAFITIKEDVDLGRTLL